jgi:hypothetical protein
LTLELYATHPPSNTLSESAFGIRPASCEQQVTLLVLPRMAASSLATGLAAPRLLAPVSPTRRARACDNAQACTALAVRGCRRRAPTASLAVGGSLAQRVVHRGAQLSLRPRARSLKQPQSRSSLVRRRLRSRARAVVFSRERDSLHRVRLRSLCRRPSSASAHRRRL